MKKATIILLSFCCLMALASCHKEGVNLFRGDYSFKTSGSATIQQFTYFFDTVTPPAYTIHLPNEIGQLQISQLERRSDSVLVVMNHLNGEVVVARGYCEGQDIYLKKFKHDIIGLSIDGDIDVRCKVQVSGKGHLYDDNTLILNLNYTGAFVLGLVRYTIESDNVQMVAYRN